MSSHEQRHEHGRRRTLTGKLLIVVNLVLVVVLGLFLVWDYYVSRHMLLEEKKIALEEEAKVLLPSAVRLREQGLGAVQDYIDEVCGAMQETTSPGHHIAVRMGDEVLQAEAHHRASPAMFVGMQQAANSPAGLATVEGKLIVVGTAARGSVVAYISEYLSNIRAAIRSQIRRRLANILMAGVVLGLAVNLTLHRLMARPLQNMVQVVHRLGQGELSARMPQTDTMELGLLADAFDRMAGALQKVEEQRQRAMNKASRIQDNLKPDLKGLAGLKARCLFQPADEVAGDYYDVMRCHDGSLILCIADVAGHGVPAAMGAGMLKAILQIAVEQESDPKRLLSLVNHAFCRVGLSEDFATMILMRWVASDSALSYASAGHEPGYLLRNEEIMRVIEPTGPVLGFEDSSEWERQSLMVEPKDRLILLTDGLAETASPRGEMFGRERLRALLAARSSQPLNQLIAQLRQELRDHLGGAAQADDMTLLAVEFQQ